MKAKSKEPKQSELQLQKMIVEWLNLQGHFAFRTNAGTMFIQGKNGMRCFKCGFKGLSDILCLMRNGQFFACEVKVGRNRATKEQKQFLEEVRNRGGIAFVAKSLDDVIGFTKQI